MRFTEPLVSATGYGEIVLGAPASLIETLSSRMLWGGLVPSGGKPPG